MVSTLHAPGGGPLRFDSASVDQVELLIEQSRAKPSLWPGLVNAFGAFLGECIAQATAGVWTWDESLEDWSIRFDNGTAVYPFAKVQKQFENGLDGDGISGFYDVAVNQLAAGKIP